MQIIPSFIVLFITVLLVGFIAVVIGAIGLGGGLLLTRVWEFSLFEASVYTLICLAFAWWTFSNFISSLLDIAVFADDDDD